MREILIAKDVAYAKKAGTASSFTADTTSGSPDLATVSSFTGLNIGAVVSGAGIPAGAFIIAMDTGAGTITLSANATATATGVTITEASVISNIREIDKLDTGAIAVFDQFNNLIDITGSASALAAALAASKWFTIAVGNQNSGTRTKMSQPIWRTGKHNIKAYVAPVKEIQYVGSDGTVGALNLPTIIAGQLYALYTFDRSNTSLDMQKPRRYEYVSKTGDTAAIILAALKAQIDADVNPHKVVETCTVVSGNVGLELTFLSGVKPQVGVDGDLANATILKDGTGASVVMNPGTGTPAQIARLEKEFAAEEGDTSRLMLHSEMWSYVDVTDTAVTYIMHTMEWAPETNNVHDTNKNGLTHECILVLPTGSSIATDINDTLVAAVPNN